MNFFKFLILSLLFIVTSQNSYSQNKLNKSKGNSLLEAIGNESFVRDITLYKMDKSLTSERIFPSHMLDIFSTYLLFYDDQHA